MDDVIKFDFVKSGFIIDYAFTKTFNDKHPLLANEATETASKWPELTCVCAILGSRVEDGISPPWKSERVPQVAAT